MREWICAKEEKDEKLIGVDLRKRRERDKGLREVGLHDERERDERDIDEWILREGEERDKRLREWILSDGRPKERRRQLVRVARLTEIQTNILVWCFNFCQYFKNRPIQTCISRYNWYFKWYSI